MYLSKKRIENHIREIQQSIKNDVGTSLEAYWKEFSENEKGVGFFAVPRMLFPEIDGLGSFITGNKDGTVLNIKSYMQKVMSLVNPKYSDYAAFIALIFRHGLLHQHSPKRFEHKKANFGWRFVINCPNNPKEVNRKRHLFFDRNNNLTIDMNVFYEDVVRSIDLFIPMVVKEHKADFKKSIKSQYKKLTLKDFLKRTDLKREDFPFLK